jgi:imidazolonepropionase-like amidohydrolase
MAQQRVDADLLIAGQGAPMPNTGVVIDDGRFVRVAPCAELAAEGHLQPVCRVPVLLPGLWDCHVHFVGLRGVVSTEELMLTPAPVAAARALKDAEHALAAGFTSVRDLGGYGIYLARVIEEETAVGPSIYGAGRVISQSGGHADAHRLPLSWVADPCRSDGMLCVADGVAECLKAVRTQLRSGAQVIKVCTSGGLVSELDHPLYQQFSDTELRAIVEEAGRSDRVVAAHCHGKAGIMAALRAGCHTIEHASHLDEEAADAIRDAGAVLVATRTAFEGLLARRDLLPPAARGKIEKLAERHLVGLRIAHAAGVTLAAGSDLGISQPGTPVSWGSNGSELRHLVAAGLSPLEAIEAGTANGPLTLGRLAPRSGLIATGYDADFIAVSGNPLDDISILATPNRITHVWKRGRLVKQPPLLAVDQLGPSSDDHSGTEAISATADIQQ